ncbi:KUP system potassium uptake protein [Nitrosospira sp. Nsp5]|uniref:Probable potassium transport system protein Kup n=1 Tax=Nitrosospira multiformis TaxID=1231 RepID=A0ABY0T809_9PROT|nr:MULTISPECIES: potassium transporter Kup [Nitrosospira]PTR05709.1 KUP system potassium uptake protein [Nitrosospira sp. Nsp5]SDQ31987.1 KUP system potassium uptake protein [Nitrosospira multiformis]
MTGENTGPKTTVRQQSLGVLSLAALGVVYGDIGTSPLYVMKTVFDPVYGLAVSEGNIIGIISLIFWAIMTVVSLKYITLILRADNKGEGGIMALLSLASSSVASHPQLRNMLFLIGGFGAALFYGDGVITPAISVLSAVEGLEVATPLLKPYVVPITLTVLIALFLIQQRGTGGIGAMFGPITLIWFSTLALAGLANIGAAPQILSALNPVHAVAFCLNNGWLAFVAFGAVVLAITGGEALYADMGHFGAKPIRFAWYGCVLPALTLNYLGQGALLLSNPLAISNPFYLLFPAWALYPAVGLATIATVIASQAVISGVFSMTKQAIQLGFLPRMQIKHTSDRKIGQIYIPFVNWTLLAAVVMAVLGFGSSSSLASAYGFAVTATMVIETLLTFFVLRYAWKYSWFLAVFATMIFITIDMTFFAATTLKIAQGGWFPLVIGVIIFTIMVTWHRGRQILFEHLRSAAIPLEPFLESLMAHPPARVAGTSIFLTADLDGVPHALLHNLAHNQVLHERVVFLTVALLETPRVLKDQRVSVKSLNNNCYQITVRYGFKDEPNLPYALELCEPYGLVFEPLKTSYFLSRQIVVPSSGAGMALWRERLFAAMTRNASNAAEYLKLPANRVLELGARVEI